jgi:glucose/arabinose dehydrogenase
MSSRRMAPLLVFGLILFLTLPAAAQLPPGGTFTDDDGNTHEGNIEAIAAEGITRGCNPPFNDHFCPDDFVTRGQMAAFLVRAFDLTESSHDGFVDVPSSHTFVNDIVRLASEGIARGCNPPANDRYCPDDFVTRGQMAAFIVRAMDLRDNTHPGFVDVPSSHTFHTDIGRLATEGITRGCNPPANDRFCPDAFVTRAQMASFLARARDLTSMTPPPRPALSWEVVVSGLTAPVEVLAPPTEDRLLIVEQNGLVRSFDDGSLSTFLDIRNQVTFAGERGLLSIAVHPDYPDDRRLFAWYYGTDGQTHLVEYQIAADLQSAGSPRAVLSVNQPFTNHNGGFLDFGADGYLYLGLGDGGSSNDPGNRARNLNTLLGKMIRIDVDGAHPYAIPSDNPHVGQSGRDEIWASGLRNPWRWSFDDGWMFIGDVGQVTREEINLVRVSPVGYDFGWVRFEGSVCNPDGPDPSCSTSGLTFPVVEYGRSLGQAVAGGVVYRGPTVRSMDQFYFYADIYSGRIWAFRHVDGVVVQHHQLPSRLHMTGIVNFAPDGQGELLAVSLFDNAIYRLTGG